MMFSSFSGRGLLKTCIAALGLSIAVGVSAEVPASKRFDLTKPSYDLFRHVSLHDSTVQQSFAFDNTNRRLFVAQLQDGSGSSKNGDLCITQLDFDGNYVGYMHLNGFGHGVSFGAEADGDATYLWTEVDAKSNGYGQKLTRFKFTSGKTISKSDKSLPKFSPIPDATEYTCSIDTVNNRLIVRYHKGSKHLAVFDLADAKKEDFSAPLADFKIPKVDTLTSVFQGYAAYGQYVYLFTGQSTDKNGGVVDSELATVDMNTGKVVQGPTLTKAGGTLSFREAEGMAIYKTAGGEVRLFLGFASGKSGDRRSNLFYKNALV